MQTEKRLAPAPVQQVAGRTLGAYAVLWGVEAAIGDSFVEVFERGAFTASLANRDGLRDPVMLVDHNPSNYLGRVANGSMRILEDARGLLVEVDLPETALGDEILALAKRADLGGFSVAFSVSPGGDSFAGNKRTVREAALYEVSAIRAHAAYADTAATVSVRSLHNQAAADLRRRLYSFHLGA